MKLQSLIAIALVVTIGSAVLAQNPAEKLKPATQVRLQAALALAEQQDEKAIGILID